MVPILSSNRNVLIYSSFVGGNMGHFMKQLEDKTLPLNKSNSEHFFFFSIHGGQKYKSHEH